MNTELIKKVAQFLAVEAVKVLKVQEWAKVLWVHVQGCRPTFISLIKFHKFILEQSLKAPEFTVIKPLVWRLESTTRRQEGKKWVARITGQDAQYTLARQFLTPSKSEWGKRGVALAEFRIDATGYYQDSDGDYFRVWVEDGNFTGEICEYSEVFNHFGVVPRCYR